MAAPPVQRSRPQRQTSGQGWNSSQNLASEQTLWPQHKDQDHRQKQNEISKLRKKRLAEIVDESDDDAADEGTKQAPGTAQDDDDERERQHVLVDARVDRKNWSADQASEPGKPRT